MRALVLLALACAGCAGCAAIPPTPQQISAKIGASQDWELCYATIRESPHAVVNNRVREAIADRRVNCNDHWPIVQAKIAADQQAAAQRQATNTGLLGALLLLQQRPSAPPPPAPVNTQCAARAAFGTLYTNCTTH